MEPTKILICFFLVLYSVRGRVYYVTPNPNTTTLGDCGDITYPCDSISRVLFNGQSNDVIRLLPGIFNGSTNTNQEIKYSVFIESVGNVTVNIQKNGFGFKMNQITLNLKGIQFVGAGDSFLDISNSHVIVQECQFYQGTTTTNGGALHIRTNSKVKIVDSEFFENSIVGNGGAIDTQDSLLYITGTTFSYNHAKSGGAIYGVGGQINITNCTFHHNSGVPQQDGAANIYLEGNEAQLFVENTDFYHSLGGSGGAAKLFVGAHAEFKNCTFSDLVAVGGGGAIFCEESIGLVTENCTFKNNIAITTGGAIYAYGNNRLNLNNTRLISNYAYFGGGGVAVGETSVAHFNNSYIFNNTAFYGGGIFIEYTSSVSLFNSSVIKNTANATEGHGGGLYCSDSNVYINETNIYENKGGDPDNNLWCAGIPAYTWCTVKGDQDWATKCGEPNYKTSDGIFGPASFPVIAILGIILAAGAIVVFVAIGITCIKWRNKKVGQKKKGHVQMEDPDKAGLLEDYD